jgi:hypothetical protein
MPSIDCMLVKRWIDDCRNHHSYCRDNRASQQMSRRQKFFPDGFRLIDVVEGKLVLRKNPCEYAALSYVWGKAALFNLCTTKRNLLDLCEPSSLYKTYNDHGVSRRLPRTIADAISLCHSVGQRYLWVDSLCILQDDQEEKKRLIHGMDTVYENADLTIVALCGSDADAGLAGITPRPAGTDNCGQPYLFHEGNGTYCVGISRAGLDEHIRSSHWNTRGWTYQEHLLSPRKLYFASGEVFYECRHERLREGYAFEGLSCHSSRPPRLSVQSNHDWHYSNLRSPHETLDRDMDQKVHKASDVQKQDLQFQRIVSLYTTMNLKEPGDILNAITGIYNRFYASTNLHSIGIVGLQGIPIRCFSRALLWFTPKQCRTKRGNISGNKPSTWSWTSLITPVEFSWDRNSNFPSSEKKVRGVINAVSLVEEWWLTFRNEGTVKRMRFRGQGFYDDIQPEEYLLPDEIDVAHFLNSIPMVECGDAASDAGSTPAIPGLLDFRGLYIPVPNAKLRSEWSQKCGREWHLSFRGIRFHDKRLKCAAIALLDSEDFIPDGFVLLLYAWNFMGICVKRVEGYFERVGVCIFTESKMDWERIREKGLLEMYWMRILLL